MTLSHWQSRRDRVNKKVDVVVVGAGIAGASTAFWLRRMAPSMQVVIVDRHEPAGGASGRNAGFLLQGHATSFAEDVDRLGIERATLFWDYTLENRDLVFSEFATAGIRLRETGSVTAAGSPIEAERLARSAELLRDAGRPARYLDAAQAADATASSGYFGGLHIATGAVVDPVRLVQAIVERAGAEVVTGLHVSALEPTPDGCMVVSDRVTYEASHVVVAVNAASGLLLPGLSSTIRPVRAQMLATDPLPIQLNVPVYSHEGYYYVRQLSSGHVLVGGARHLHRAAEVGHEDATTVALQEDLSRYLRTHFSWCASHTVKERWSGTMAFTDDKLPKVGHIPGLDRAVWVGGFSGHGMSMAFLTGRVVADILLQRSRHPVLDLLEV